MIGKHGDRIKLKILETGLRLWCDNPRLVTARRIAVELNMVHSAVLYHFGTADRLRNAIAFHAVKQGESRVIAHLIAGNHASVRCLTDAECREHCQRARRYALS